MGRRLGKKAQLTIFLIVGIILLFSSAIVFYIKGEVIEDVEAELPKVERVPLELLPLKTFVEDCIRDVATDAILKLGRFGGYVDPDDPDYTGTFLTAGYEPTESDVLVFLGDKKIPYWWYLESDNDCLAACKFDSKRPPLAPTGGPTSIVNQINTYIKKELSTCTKEFSSFEVQGFSVDAEAPPEAEVRLTEEDVLIITDYPLTVSREGTTTDMKQFLSRVDIPLKSVYGLATDIANSEIEFKFLENHIMNLIMQYSKPMDSRRIPPISDVRLDPGEFTVWTRSQTQDRLESYVLPRISMLQVIGSYGYARNVMLAGGEIDEIAQGLMDNTNIFLNSSEVYENVQADFAYLDWWPIYLNINDQEVLMADSVMNEFLPIIPKVYRFYYDLSFPVLVTLQVPAALKGEGYRFVFALEANIRNNFAFNESMVMFKLTDDFGSMVCDPGKRNSGTIKIETVDLITREPIEDVMVSAIYGEEFCFMGFTELNEDNESVLVTNFPVGIGQVSLRKKGYPLVSEAFGAFLDTDANHTFEMLPVKLINTTVRTKNMLYEGHKEYIMADPANPAAEGPVGRDMRAFITLTRVDQDAYYGYETYVMFDGDEGPTITEMIPGNYEAVGFLIDEGGLYLPAKTIKIDTGPFTGDKLLPLNETDIEQWLHGGIKLQDGKGTLSIPRDELFESNHMVFYVLHFPKPQLMISNVGNVGDTVDITQIGLHAEYSEKYQDALQPTFSRVEPEE